MTPGCILIVDDERGVRQICKRTLDAMGFAVYTAPDGREALKRLGEQECDLVVTDIAMPAMDGKQLTEEIKRRWATTDVAIMTAYPGLDSAIPTLKNGACDYLIKPFGPDALQTLVARCFEKRRLSRELNRERTMRRELAAAYQELQKVERLKEAILSRLSHELKTPLCAGLLGVQALTEMGLDDRSRRYCGMIHQGLGQLQETVEELLLFAQLAQADPEIRKTAFNVRQYVQELVARYDCLLRERRLTVDIKWNGGERLPCDPERISSALKHLFLNSVQFNKPGGRITIESRRTEKFYIAFSDTGEGIPQEQLREAFDGFYQAADYLTRRVGGLGLGLAIVRRIAEAHGGSVSVDSALGRGSTFTLGLPCA